MPDSESTGVVNESALEAAVAAALDAQDEPSGDGGGDEAAASTGWVTPEQQITQTLAELDRADTEATGDDSELEAARAAISRLPGVPKGVLEGLDRDAILEWGRSAKDARGQQDDVHRQLAELRDLLTQPKGEDSVGSEPAPTVDPSTELRKALEPLLEELPGEEAANALISGLEAITKPLHERIAQLTSDVQATRTTSEAGVLAASREELASLYPTVADEGAWQSRVDYARRLVTAGLASDLPSALRDAARNAWGDGHREEATTDADLNRRRSSTANKGGKRMGRPAMSEEQKLISLIDSSMRRHGDVGD